MTCPSCGKPLFFGAIECGCGYQETSAGLSNIELSYWEALRVYWCVYWPMQLFALAGYFPVIFLGLPGRTVTLRFSFAGQLLIQAFLSAIGLFLYVHRMLSLPYRGFSIRLVPGAAGMNGAKLNLRRRSQLWFYLWWRQIVAGLLAGILTAPANIVLSLLGVRAIFGINVGSIVVIFGTLLAIGPILVKMLIGHDFSDFLLEVDRSAGEDPGGRAAIAANSNPA